MLELYHTISKIFAFSYYSAFHGLERNKIIDIRHSKLRNLRSRGHSESEAVLFERKFLPLNAWSEKAAVSNTRCPWDTFLSVVLCLQKPLQDKTTDFKEIFEELNDKQMDLGTSSECYFPCTTHVILDWSGASTFIWSACIIYAINVSSQVISILLTRTGNLWWDK